MSSTAQPAQMSLTKITTMADVPEALEYFALQFGAYDHWDAQWIKDEAKTRGFDITEEGCRALESSCGAWWASVTNNNEKNHTLRELLDAKYRHGIPECEWQTTFPTHTISPPTTFLARQPSPLTFPPHLPSPLTFPPHLPSPPTHRPRSPTGSQHVPDKAAVTASPAATPTTAPAAPSPAALAKAPAPISTAQPGTAAPQQVARESSEMPEANVSRCSCSHLWAARETHHHLPCRLQLVKRAADATAEWR
jgi:hypothetical protein